MISSGIMILVLLIFIIAIGLSFYGGFSVGRKIQTQTTVQQPQEYVEPKQSFFDKIITIIEDRIPNKNKDRDADDEIKTVVTTDGIRKNANDFY